MKKNRFTDFHTKKITDKIINVLLLATLWYVRCFDTELYVWNKKYGTYNHKCRFGNKYPKGFYKIIG